MYIPHPLMQKPLYKLPVTKPLQSKFCEKDMMAVLCLWVTLLVELLMLVNPGHGSSSVAPGDEEPLCPQLRAQGAAPIPAYSANMRVLMDSWNYRNLLPTRTGAVWDRVDNDENNPSGVTTNWIQNSNVPCGQFVQVCGFGAGPQDNWLITQLINRTVNGTRLPQVSVMIEFELQNCDTTLNCQRTFNTHIYETSTVNAIAARNISNYRQVQRVSPDVTTGERVNETVTVNFNTNHSSFYFAIQDETTCIIITRLIVVYDVCPSQTIGLIHTPEVIAPATGSAPITANGRCVENALTEDGSAPRLICSTGGIWSPVQGRGCRCAPGYTYSRVNETCIFTHTPTTSPLTITTAATSGPVTTISANTDTPATSPLTTTTAATSGPVTTISANTDVPPELVLTPPNEIISHCSHVTWRNSPDVFCEDISGYDVRLFNPDTEEEVVRHVDARGTFHNFLILDKDLIEQKSTTIQIRIVSSTEVGTYSSPVEVGCFVPQSSSVYFELKGKRYDNNSAINIHAIGEGDNALLCKTNKQECCGTRPNRFGEFFYPNGVQVPIRSAGQDFYRNRGDQLIRLNRRGGASSPTGKYYCEIPDAGGVTQKIYVNIASQ